MTKNIQIDRSLLDRAQKVGGFKSMEETVNTALEEYLHFHNQRRICDLFGTVELWPKFDHKLLRAKR